MSQTWEYRVTYDDPAKVSDQMEQLDQLGAEGWELVSATHWNQWMYFYLKRPKS